MGTPHEAGEQSRMFPLTPRAETELQLILTSERLTTGHLMRCWNIGIWDAEAGPLALAAGPFEPFAPASTAGGAAQRLVRAWWQLTSTPRQVGGYGHQDGTDQLLKPWFDHLDLRGRVSDG